MNTPKIDPARSFLRRIVICASVACAAWISGTPLGARSPDSISLLLKWRHQFQFAGYYAAQVKGFYAEEGLNVTILEGGPDRTPIASILAGVAQFGVSDSQLVLARLRGKPVVACAAIFQHSPYVILSRRDRMIRAPADLLGRTVMLSDEQGEAQLRTMLSHEGIDSTNVSVLKHSWRLLDLIEGKVDAISAYAMVEPEQMRAMGVEPSVLRALDYGVDFYGDTLFTTESQAREHPERTSAFIRASLRGWEYAMDHPEEIIHVILQKDGVRARGVTPETLRAEAAGMKSYVLRDVVPMGHMNPGRWQRIADLYRASGQETSSGSLEDFIYNPDKPRERMVMLLLAGLVILLLGSAAFVLRSMRNKRRALLDVQMLLEGMLDNSPALIFIKDTAGRYLLVNRQFEKQFGLSRSAVLGKTDREIFEPAQAAVFMANDQEAARGPGTFEESAVYADGPHMSIVSKFPVLDSSGKTRGVGGIATDITEIRRAQETILEQASLLEKARDAIIVRNLDHRITYWNNSAQRLYGWTADEAVGRIATELIYRDTESFSQAHEQMMRTGEWVGEARQVSRQGAELVVDSRWTLVRDEKGQPRSILTINTDITEKRKLEQQFLRAQRLESIGTLAGGIAHDLNNVLTPILLTAELLQSTETSPRARDLLERIKRSAERGADMVNQVLTFARGAEGKRAALRAEDIITDVVRIVRDTFPRYIEVALDVEPGLPFIYGEPTQLHQVLLNLCVNARDAIGGNGKISITARKTPTPDSHKSSEFPDGWIRIDVEDTGNGIPPENLDKVFDPFFTTKATGAGTGLGLSTSQTIVKDHGGTIEVESRPGRTRFSVYLPAQIQGHTTGLPASRELPPGNGETILLTEDEAMIRDIIAQTLASSGYQPIFASNGAEAVERVAREGAGIRAVIVDMMMPVMNGPEAIREMIQRQPGIKIIACSGIPANESIALAAGASAFMAKPYSTETLLCKLHELLHPG